MPSGFQVSQLPVPNILAENGVGGYYTPVSSTDGNLNYLGQEFTILCPTFKKLKKVRIVKNASNSTLYANELVKFSTTAGEFTTHVGALTAANAEKGWPVDCNVPSTGVPNGSWFLLVMEGLNYVMLPATEVAAAAWSVGSQIVATASGRAVVFDPNLGTTTQSNQILGIVGKMLSAATSSNTSATKTVWVGHP
jgi:hypothetical protein